MVKDVGLKRIEHVAGSGRAVGQGLTCKLQQIILTGGSGRSDSLGKVTCLIASAKSEPQRRKQTAARRLRKTGSLVYRSVSEKGVAQSKGVGSSVLLSCG